MAPKVRLSGSPTGELGKYHPMGLFNYMDFNARVSLGYEIMEAFRNKQDTLTVKINKEALVIHFEYEFKYSYATLRLLDEGGNLRGRLSAELIEK